MKKIAILMSVLMVLGMCSVVFAFGNARQNELRNDPNYEFVYTHGGGQAFLDLSSVSVDEYNPPVYQIEADAVYVSDEGRERNFHPVFRYNYDQQAIYARNQSGKWQYLNANGTMGEACDIAMAQAMFRQAYDIDF